MNLLWELDQSLFRVLHLDLGIRAPETFRFITDMGLGHVQLAALLLIAYKRDLGIAWTSAIFFGVALLLGFVESRVHTGFAFMAFFILMGSLKRPYALGAFWAASIAGALRMGFIQFFERERPSNFWYSQPIEEVYGSTSFPSGHATITLAIGIFFMWTLVENRLRWTAWIRFAVLLLIAFSRIIVGVHYPTDILGALLFACAISSGFWAYGEPRGWFRISRRPSSGSDRIDPASAPMASD